MSIYSTSSGSSSPLSPPPMKMARFGTFGFSPSSDSSKSSVMETNELGGRLYALLEEGTCTDVCLVVEGGDTKIKVHKAVLVAMSQVFATMTTERWTSLLTAGDAGHSRNIEGKKMLEIELPTNVGVDAVNVFVKFLYTETLEEKNLDTGLLLEVMFLADHYAVKRLTSKADNLLASKLNADNCTQILEYTRLFDGVQITRKALDCLTKNLEYKLKEHHSLNWDKSTWKTVLESNYVKGVKEVELFQNLLAWRNEDKENRAEHFNNLMKLIRLNLIGFKDFASVVVPSETLSQDQVIQFFLHLAGTGPSLPFSGEPRNKLEPHDSDELLDVLTYCSRGDIIQLQDKSYEGPFTIWQEKVTLRGGGAGKTIINSASFGLDISCGDIAIEGLTVNCVRNDRYFGIRILGGSCTIKDLEIIGGNRGIILEGDSSTLQTININNSHECISMEGWDNKISDCTLKSSRFGCVIKGDKNELDNIALEDVSEGLKIDGSKNLVSHINFVRTETSQRGGVFTAVSINSGKKNRLSQIKCEGLQFGVDPQDLALSFGPLTSFNEVNGCGPGRVCVAGRNHGLKNLNSDPCLVIFGTGHYLENCRSQTLARSLEAEFDMTNCHFPSVEFDDDDDED